jgi:hypothetical protein
MPSHGVISVEVGGHLIVTNSKITNDCVGCFWQGIQAWGNAAYGQVPATQGWVQIQNGSTIEHAEVGVCNYSPADPTDTTSYTGGIIQCNNSNFKNNNIAVQLLPFQNVSTSSLPLNDVSYFNRCTFTSDKYYKGDKMVNHPMKYFAYLSGVRGVNFRGCRFMNVDKNYTNTCMGDGIHALNAGFNVIPFCSVSSPSGCTGSVYFRWREYFALQQCLSVSEYVQDRWRSSYPNTDTRRTV